MSSVSQDHLDNAESRRAIEELFARYNRICDRGYLPDELAPLFAEDGVWANYDRDGNPDFGVLEGRGQIWDFFNKMNQSGTYGLHVSMNPEIEILSSDTARGTWTTLSVLMVPDSTGAESLSLRAGVSSDTYVKVDGDWLWKTKTVRALMKQQLS